MTNKKIVVTIGPIPAKLDSVKYITNRFKGGLSSATAEYLAMQGNDVTVVCWKYANLNFSDHMTVVLVDDVNDYYRTVLGLVEDNDAFVLAAAVANLCPVQTIQGKFPSHRYKEGDVFPLDFTIAPRVIDAIKKQKSHVCLIGYKLFDGTNDELIAAARKTIDESRANAVFANDPSTPKEKYLCMPDGAVIPMGFDEHNRWINRIVNLEHDRCVREVPKVESKTLDRIGHALVEHFERYIRTDGHGSCCFPIAGRYYMSARNHDGVSIVHEVRRDGKTTVVYSGKKPTKNAALMHAEASGGDFIHHLHTGSLENKIPYRFPGTQEEESQGIDYEIEHHGVILHRKLKDVNWRDYYILFPSRYFSTHSKIEEIYSMDADTLDVGCNTKNRARFGIDPSIGIGSYDDLLTYNAIAINNSINYLEKWQIEALKESLRPGGFIRANTFRTAPGIKITEDEIVVANDTHVYHYLWKDGCYYDHTFFNRDIDYWRDMGFSVIDSYNSNSVILEYKREGDDGETLPLDAPPTQTTTHIMTCLKHPMRDVEAELDALRLRVEALEATVAYLDAEE